MKYFKFLVAAIIGLLLPLSSAYAFFSAHGDWGSITVNTRLRQYLSVNLSDPFPADNHDDRWGVSMVRTGASLFVDGDLKGVGFHVLGRLVREQSTGYLNRLQAHGADLGGSLPRDFYDQNELREWYVDVPLTLLGIPLGHGSKLRVGKQQVAFGNTDFFHVLDQVNGFDYTWRSFLVGENEEIRKPLFMANLIVNLPQFNGQAQFLLIPGAGFNRERDYGNNYDIFGGRWANQPYKAVDFIDGGGAALVPYNYESRDADTRDPGYAFRWNGHFGGSNYSLVYLHQHNGDPVFNSKTNPWKQTPKGVLGDAIYPFVDIIGVTANTFIGGWLDAVLSTEIGYTFDKPYNIGTNPVPCAGGIPGLCGIQTEDTLQAVLRIDKQLRFLEGILKTRTTPFFSLQVFETWVPGLKAKDGLVSLAGYAAPLTPHQTILTGILSWSYMNASINPGLAGGVDLTHGGSAFFIPSIDFHFGNHWRIKVEADLFFSEGNKITGDSSDTYLLDYFDNNNQFMTRITYQF